MPLTHMNRPAQESDVLLAMEGRLQAQTIQKVNKVQEAWITPTLVNGATGSFQYRKNGFGRLEFKGELTQASTAAYFAITITGYRPPVWIRCPITSIDGVVSMLVLSDAGALYLHTPLAGKTISFSGISINIQ